MKGLRNGLSSVFLFLLMINCHTKTHQGDTLPEIITAFENNQLSLATRWAGSMLSSGQPDSVTAIKLIAIIDRTGRINADFTLSESEIETRLLKEFGAFSPDQKKIWESKNWLEYRVIDGEKRYFKRAVPNLKLILKSHLAMPAESVEFSDDKFDTFKLIHSRKVIQETASVGQTVEPVKMKVTYRVTVKPDAVPHGQTVRCWMPWPREVHQRQINVKLLQSSPVDHFIAPDSTEQRSIYLEQVARQSKPVVFEIQFSYQSMAQYFDLQKDKIANYDTAAPLFKKYTAAQYPQIDFTNEIKQLSDSIVHGETNPYEKVRRLYSWINNHIIWTGALEYSIIPFIPGYVLKNQRGDCGMQTLLLISMARYQRIPVKWQSGWMMHPGEVNLHDWCEVYYQGIGWIPLDMSFNLQKSSRLPEKEFYITGIDAYRLIVNDAIGTQLNPVKRHPRSEPYDFQRGEVEWQGGNLYFNQWDYHMTVEYQ